LVVARASVAHLTFPSDVPRIFHRNVKCKAHTHR
jgi:hypothetical protein